MLPMLLVPLALAFGLAAGGSHHQPAPAPAAVAADTTAKAAPAAEATVIEFENQSFDMATVYLVPQAGMPVRLGQVNPGRTQRLVVPRGVVGGLTSAEIVAVPFAHRYWVGSGPVTLGAGDSLRASLSSTANMVSILPGD